MSINQIANLQAELQLINESLTLCDEFGICNDYTRELVKRKAAILNQSID